MQFCVTLSTSSVHTKDDMMRIKMLVVVVNNKFNLHTEYS